MAKQHEIEYAERMNAGHAVNKPFSDGDRARNLMRMGALFALLPPPPARVLDLGCGTGWTSAFYARSGYDVVGVDIAPEMIRLATEQRDAAGLTNLTFVVSDYETLALRDEFDCAIFFDSLHHADDEGLAVRRAFAALKPGGLCVAAEPGAGHAHSDEAAHAVAEHGVTEKDMPPERVVALGRAAGFTGFRVFPNPDELCKSLYGVRQLPLPDGDSTLGTDTARNLLTRVWWRCQLALSPSQARWRKLLYSLQRLRTNGLVLMQKPAAGATRAAA